MLEIIGWVFVIMVIVFLLGTMYSICDNIIFRDIDEIDADEVFDEE